jgi:hypothetical protein
LERSEKLACPALVVAQLPADPFRSIAFLAGQEVEDIF